jgi:hypothetical protein
LNDLQGREAEATTRLMLPARRSLRGFRIYLCAPESAQPQGSLARAQEVQPAVPDNRN